MRARAALATAAELLSGLRRRIDAKHELPPFTRKLHAGADAELKILLPRPMISGFGRQMILSTGDAPLMPRRFLRHAPGAARGDADAASARHEWRAEAAIE